MLIDISNSNLFNLIQGKKKKNKTYDEEYLLIFTYTHVKLKGISFSTS